MYGDIAGADAYWESRLFGNLWLIQSTTTKNQALQSASDRINLLSLEGTPNTSNAEGVHYPLEGETEVPQGILYATYELALCLIQNPPMPSTGRGGGMANVKRTKIGVTETEFFGTVSPWISAGIPCQNVWQMLDPFMSDPGEIIIIRES